MDLTAQNGVRVEREMLVTVAMVIDGAEMGEVLGESLIKQGLRVERRSQMVEKEELPGLRYVFLFLRGEQMGESWKDSLEKTIATASQNGSKLVLILDNLPTVINDEVAERVKKYGWVATSVEVKGKLMENEEISGAVGKIVRLAFSSRQEEKIIILGQESGYIAPSEQYFPKIDEAAGLASAAAVRWNDYPKQQVKLQKEEKVKKKKGKLRWIVFAVILVLFLPLIAVLSEVGLGVWQLKVVEQNLRSGNYVAAKQAASEAEDRFRQGKEIVGAVSLLSGEWIFNQQRGKAYELLLTAEIGANTLYRVASIEPVVSAIPKAIFDSNAEFDLDSAGKAVSLEATAIDQNLGLIQAEWESGSIKFLTRLAPIFGVSGEKVTSYFDRLDEYRQMVRKAQAAMLVLPDLTGSSGKKTYLVVFQNSAELRPTGGFIGSYAIVHFDGGKILDYKINDIYTADGQLKGSVTPPDEILHYLGQPNWFMRDANFGADFPLTAQRLEWFLNKETGENVDGVIGVNLGAVQKILTAVGGVKVAGEKELVSGDNFFNKAEYASEINFFPGSTQKRDFLGQVGEAILGKITQGTNGEEMLALGQALVGSLNEKDIMLYFNSTGVQKVMEQNLWAGGIREGECSLPNANCTLAVEANFGANKANYFVKQSMSSEVSIDKGGGISDKIILNIRNESPSESWPGGMYKNYVRFLAPLGSKLLGMDLGDGRKASVSAVLNAPVLAKVAANQFLVYQTTEPAVVGPSATNSGYVSFGALVTTPVSGNSVITVNLLLPQRLDFTKNEVPFEMVILKQPGNTIDSLQTTINYPSFLTPELDSGEKITPLASEQRLQYNMDLSIDRIFKIRFKN